MSAIILPPIPTSATPAMQGFVDRYLTAFNTTDGSDDEIADGFKAAANDVQLYPATTVANLAAKLLVSLHYLHPDRIDGQLAVDPDDFEMTLAGEMLLSALVDAVRLATPAVSREAWDQNLAIYRAASAAYQASCNTYGRLRSDEPGYDEIDRENDATMTADIEAETVLISTPAPDIAAARIKAEILYATHHHSEHLRALVADLANLEGRAA